MTKIRWTRSFDALSKSSLLKRSSSSAPPPAATSPRHSDLDLLIIKEGGDARLRGRIHERLLWRAASTVDAILVSPADVKALAKIAMR